MGGRCLIGWLPEVSLALFNDFLMFNYPDVIKVKGTEADKHNQKRWTAFQSLLYQQAMGEILGSLKHAAYWGVQITCDNGITR